MTSVLITWKNLPKQKHVYTVFHNVIPKTYKHDKENCLVIPTRLDGDFSDQILITESTRKTLNFSGVGVAVTELPVLDDGDIVSIDCNRLVVVFNIKGCTNALYVTNACNSKCQFCPQPSSPDNGGFYQIAKELISLVDDPTGSVNITGGEPTIQRKNFISLLEHFSTVWPTTKAFVLTNGRLLCENSYVEDIYKAIPADRIAFGIPLYSDASCIHDNIVGAPGAFGQTIRGLYNLASKRAEIELRVVFSKLTYRRLPKLIQYVGRNLPFITRIAIMGIEPMGFCRNNWDKFWIDPDDAREILSDTFLEAKNFGLRVLLYNFQLCCLSQKLRKYACSTISEWKRVYTKECLYCPLKSDCGGFFASQISSYLPRRFYDNSKQK